MPKLPKLLRPIRKSAQKHAKAEAPVSAKREGPRRLQAGKYRSFHLSKRIKAKPRHNVPGAFRLLGRSLRVLKRHWKLFLGIALIYGILNMVLVRGFSAGTDLATVKSTFRSALGSGLGSFGSSVTVFVYLLGTTGNTTSAAANAYQIMLAIIVSLALIWTLREAYAGHKTRIRDGFYRGMHPLVTFLLVLAVVALESAPMLVGMFLFLTVMNNGIAVGGLEQALWTMILLVLTLISLYMVTASLFALYIVALPDATPVQSLRAAAKLVRFRRWLIMRKIVFLPLALLVLAGIVMVPIILIVPAAAPWAFFVVSMLLLPVIHSYMYALYRALL
jgi:hypothetical protein